MVRDRRVLASAVLRPSTVPESPPTLWTMAGLTYVAQREDLGLSLLWLLANCPAAGGRPELGGLPLDALVPTPGQLARLVELACECEDLPEALAWTLAHCEPSRPLTGHLCELMVAAGTWDVEGGARLAVQADGALEVLLVDDTWHRLDDLPGTAALSDAHCETAGIVEVGRYLSCHQCDRATLTGYQGLALCLLCMPPIPSLALGILMCQFTPPGAVRGRFRQNLDRTLATLIRKNPGKARDLERWNIFLAEEGAQVPS